MRFIFRKFRDLRVSLKISGLLVAVVLLSLAFTAYSIFRNIEVKVEVMLGQRLEHIVRTGAMMIPGEEHERVFEAFLHSEEDPVGAVLATKEFESIRETLRAIQSKNELHEDIYTLIRPEWSPEHMMFLVMTPEEHYVGNGMAIHPKVREVFDTGKPAHTKLYTDAEGIWVSAFAPIKRKDGTTVAVVEVDYGAAGEIAQAKYELARNIAIPALVALALSILIGAISGKQLASPIKRLASVAEEVSGGNLDTSITYDSRDEIGLLATTFNKMISDLRESRDALEEYNRNLEALVAERTEELSNANKTINAMLDSLGQGFLVFDGTGEVSPICSKAASRLLEGSPATRKIWDVLKHDEQTLSDWCQFLFDEPLPFESVKSAGPTQFEHSEGLKIDIDYHPVRNDDGKVSNVVVVTTDRTQEYLAHQEAEKNRLYSEMITKIVKSKNQFLSFTNDAHSMIAEMQRIMTLSDYTSELKAILRYAHTIKGGAAAFSIQEVRDEAHHFEDKLNELSQEGDTTLLDSKDLVSQELGKLANAFDGFIDEARLIIGKAIDDGQMREIPLTQLVEFSKEIHQHHGAEALLPEFNRRFIAVPIQTCFEHFDNIIEEVAGRQGKQVSSLQYTGGDLRVLSDPYSDLFASMVHAFRNAIDHGIETPDIRQMFGKPESGTIEITFDVSSDKNGDWLNITVSDDGGGIDADKLRKRLLDKGVASAADESDEEIIQHVFDSGVSTKDQVSDISGRGVGMDAIRFAAESLGGTARVSTEVTVGSKLFVTVPFLEEIAPVSSGETSDTQVATSQI